MADILGLYKVSLISEVEMLNVFIAGQKGFGAAVYKMLKEKGYNITGVACPQDGQYYDRLKKAAYTSRPQPKIIDSKMLRASDIPKGTDVLIAAHSHHFISKKVRESVKYAIAYHPSLLPRHRGKDSIKWTVRFGDSITGGTVFLLNDKVDGGDIILQEPILVHRSWSYKDLWRKALFPLGLKLLGESLEMIEKGNLSLKPQDENTATWEPAIEPARLHRPDLLMLEFGSR